MISGLNRDARATLRVLGGTALGILPVKQMFTDSGWLIDVWLTMAILVLPAVALRIRSRPAAWQLVPGMAFATFFLTARFLPDHALFGFVPTTSTGSDLGHLSQLVRAAMSDEAAPVHTTPAIRFYLAAGLALLAALIDVVAVCIKAPALTGIAFLLAATISGAVSRHAVGWALIAGGGVGYLLVLSAAAGSDLARWGRRAPDGANTSVLRSQAGESGRRIGAISLVLALIIASIVPIPAGNAIANVLHHNGDAGTGKGGGGVFLDPLATLRGQLTRSTPVNLFTVNVSSAKGGEPFYLRQEVLETYTGTAWIQSDPSNATSRTIQPGGFTGRPAVSSDHTADDTYTAKIHIEQAAGAPPLFYLPQTLSGADGGWRWDTSTQLVVGNVSRNLTYTEQVEQPRPTAAQLGASDPSIDPEAQRDLQLPSNMPSVVATLVNGITSGAPTAYARALSIFNFFADPANNFVYSLNTKVGDSGNDLVDFLNNRVGYCQQYAAAMGVMLRLAGVPARVVLGYTHPAADKNGQFQVTTNDAHAWVEAYFGGIGWVPFDPTPLTGSDTARSVSLAWAPREAGSGVTSTLAPTGGAAAQSAAAADRNSAAASAAAHASSSDLSRWAPRVLLGLAIAVVLMLLPALLRWLRRRRRLAAARTGRPLALWVELRDTCVDLGIGWSPARTPRQVVTWLREFGLDREGVSQLKAITDTVELFSYGPKSGVNEILADELGASLQVVRRQLITSADPGARWRMRLWPVSLWRSADGNPLITRMSTTA
jgi:transglutaminase-like putative cysteine protease